MKNIRPVVEDVPLSRSEIDRLSPDERIMHRGYRSYVGGGSPEKWYGIGRLQYHFLVKNGLKPHHKFLDLGCGSLRLGMYLIPYMEIGRYYGLEPEELLVQAGLENEFFFEVWKEKKPVFFHNYEFDFHTLDHFDFAMANSIFTHLNKEDIGKCFNKLIEKATEQSIFFFTFFEGSSDSNKFRESHANRRWEYSFKEISELTNDWNLEYIGDWNHPVNQKMVKAIPK